MGARNREIGEREFLPTKCVRIIHGDGAKSGYWQAISKDRVWNAAARFDLA